MNSWLEYASCYHPGSSSYPFQSISGLAFDVCEERLWLTDCDGYLASYAIPDCLPYSSTRTCWGTTYDDADWGITSLARTALRPMTCARLVRRIWLNATLGPDPLFDPLTHLSLFVHAPTPYFFLKPSAVAWQWLPGVPCDSTTAGVY